MRKSYNEVFCFVFLTSLPSHLNSLLVLSFFFCKKHFCLNNEIFRALIIVYLAIMFLLHSSS